MIINGFVLNVKLILYKKFFISINLIIHLKRWNHEYHKKKIIVNYNETIDLTQYIGQDIFDVINDNPHLKQNDNVPNKHQNIYQLIAVINHIDTKFGYKHYTTYAKARSIDNNQSNWVLFDDSTVSQSVKMKYYNQVETHMF